MGRTFALGVPCTELKRGAYYIVITGLALFSNVVLAANWNTPKIDIQPLEFNVGSNLDRGSSLRNILYLPSEPAQMSAVVVMLHSCAGIKPSNKGDLIRWGQLLLGNRYGVLFVDHLSPRGVATNCGRKGRHKVPRHWLVNDVYDAAEFLGSQESTIGKKIFTLGFSLGAMTGGSAASASFYKRSGDDSPKLSGVMGLYGGCYGGGGGRWLEPDSDIPVLWMVGGRDREAPPDSCASSVRELEKRGLMTFHEYPEAVHCWDCRLLSGFTKTAGNGNRVTYQYDEQVTRDSERRVLDFLEKFSK